MHSQNDNDISSVNQNKQLSSQNRKPSTPKATVVATGGAVAAAAVPPPPVPPRGIRTPLNPIVPGAGGNVLPSTPNRYLQPIFRTNRLTTSVTVYDGQTLVLGGMITNQIVSIDDKVPGLGEENQDLSGFYIRIIR